MVDLLVIASREFMAGREDNAVQLLHTGLNWSFWRCWKAKENYNKWLKRKLAKSESEVENDNR